MTHDILDELAVPPPPYRAWRATLAVAQKQEPKEPQPQNVPKEVPKNPEIQKPTWAESSAEIRSKTDPAVQELTDMKVPEALEDRKRAAIAEAKEVIRLQLETNAKMSEQEAEKKSDTSATVILPRMKTGNLNEEAMVIPGKDGGEKTIRYDVPESDQSRAYYEKVLDDTKDPAQRAKLQGIINDYKKAEKPKGLQVGDMVVVGQSKAKVLEVGANGEPTRLDAFEGPAAQVAPQAAPKPVEQKPEPKEPEPKSPKVVISAKPIGDGKIASKFGPGAEPGENKEQKIFEPTTPKEAAPIAPEVGLETVYVKPAKKAKEELPENKQLLEDRMVAYGGGMSNGKFDGLKKEATSPSKEERVPDQELTPHVAEDLKHQEQLAKRRMDYAHKSAIKMDEARTAAQVGAKEGRVAAGNETAQSENEPISRREFLGLPKTETEAQAPTPAATEALPAAPVTPEVGSETVYEKPKEKAPEPVTVERPRFQTGRELVKYLWEGTGIGLKSETFWGRMMANIHDGAANYWLGPVLRGQARLDKYKDRAKDFEGKMNDSNWQFARDWYRTRMLKAQQKVNMAEMKLGVYTMKKDMYESRRADYCREVGRKYEAHIAPYEAQIRGAQELISQKVAAEDTLLKMHKEQLALIGELNVNAKTRFGGIVKDRESVRKIKAAEKILQGIDKELSRSQKARFQQQGQIARLTSRIAPWKARQQSILEFGVSTDPRIRKSAPPSERVQPVQEWKPERFISQWNALYPDLKVQEADLIKLIQERQAVRAEPVTKQYLADRVEEYLKANSDPRVLKDFRSRKELFVQTVQPSTS